MSWNLKENCSLKIHWKSEAKIICLGVIWFSCWPVSSSVACTFCYFKQSMNLRIVFKFKDCKLQFYEKRRFSYFSVNPRTPASRWRRLLKLKRININSFKIIIGFFFTPPLFLATKVAISFVYCSPKTIKCTQKPKIEKSLQGSTNWASERASECHSHIISTTRSCACAQFTS